MCYFLLNLFPATLREPARANGTASAPISAHGFNRKQPTEPALLPCPSSGFFGTEEEKGVSSTS
jgi:hypothetical protein